MDDKQILELLWNRLEIALDALAAKYGRQLHRTATNILSDNEDAEEVVNDTYLAIWNAIPPERPNSLAGYIHRICRNISLKKLRFQRAQKRNNSYWVSLDELAGIIPDSTLEEVLDARELGRTIDRFLDTLSNANRRIFLRRYWFGDSLQELALQEHLSINALTVRLSRLRNQLKDYLFKEGIFDETRDHSKCVNRD